MKDYKFRGMTIDTKKLVYGYHLVCDEKHFIIEEGCSSSTYDRFSVGIDYGELNEVLPASVGLGTGLKDKNGKEIYAGDKIRGRVFLNDGYDKEGWLVNGTVSWDVDYAVWIFAPIKTPVENYHSMLWQIEEIEVIGNIHENPEMLEAKP